MQGAAHHQGPCTTRVHANRTVQPVSGRSQEAGGEVSRASQGTTGVYSPALCQDTLRPLIDSCELTRDLSLSLSKIHSSVLSSSSRGTELWAGARGLSSGSQPMVVAVGGAGTHPSPFLTRWWFPWL